MTFYAGEFLGLPGLRAYWPMNAFDASGNTIDQAGLDLVLTINGNPTYNYTTQGAGYIDLDGTGDYLSRADEASLDILGTETSVASAVRGLTLGGWFWLDAGSADGGLITKRSAAAGNFSYYLRITGTDDGSLSVSSNGSTETSVSAAGAVLTAGWYFIAGRFTPSTELKVWVNGSSSINTTSIPASIFQGSGALNIGGFGGGSGLINGRASNCFLCGALLSDTAISNLYNNTKAAYGL